MLVAAIMRQLHYVKFHSISALYNYCSVIYTQFPYQEAGCTLCNFVSLYLALSNNNVCKHTSPLSS